MELLAASVAGSFFRRRKKAHQRIKRCPVIRDCNATRNREMNVVSWTVSRRSKWFQRLVVAVVLCWRSTCIHQAHPVVEALLSAVAHARHPSHHDKFWGVAVRGGDGDGTPVDSTNADCHNNNNNNREKKDVSSFRKTHDGLPPDFPRWDDVTTAMAAVRKACAVTVALQPVHEDDAAAGTMEMTKEDASPVTVADLAVQAVVLHHLLYHPNNQSAIINMDGFIAEEDTTKLRQSPALCQQVADAAQLTTAQVLHAIDAGQSHRQWTTATTNSSIVSSRQRPRRVWCLDPIDGTRGFLRGRRAGGQYAVALALLEDGVPVIGVLGCPNLPHNDTTTTANLLNWSNDETDETSSAHRGCLFVASQGGGCYQLSVPSAPCVLAEDTTATTPRRLHVTSTGSIRHGRFCIGVESYSDAQGQTVQMARLLHGPEGVRLDNNDNNNTIVRARRMDSQAKHGVVARGGAEWYVRLPPPGYVEWIWDHAAGLVVATEAGGTVTDTRGRPLDFSLGAQLSPDVQGVLMSSGGKWHDALVRAYAAVVDQDNAATTTAAAAATKSECDRLE